ncbi:type IV pilus modification protein PilV [Acinetobacter puyangensis]|uniref:Type IV pilus assembly protein PilV n=1 Tax=Acinetobacter puyangensis TaxID=1096779 RepID=A0A240E9H7_9GAMM|nr:type IV pilus modification protein PilV [Acinetobacter puyangensis]SNX44565.1 type IV pilus assembly protein PilV [Acinetobacter puyangensis]
MIKQQGVGLTEVLVALILLSIAVLGFVALQIRALAASYEAGQQIQAINLARDLSERMRINRAGLRHYQDISSPATTCAAAFCTANEMAQYDFAQVKSRASDLGMQINIWDCQGSTLKRKCIYVAWSETTASNGNAAPHCTNGTAYVPNAKCIIMEVYNYD